MTSARCSSIKNGRRNGRGATVDINACILYCVVELVLAGSDSVPGPLCCLCSSSRKHEVAWAVLTTWTRPRVKAIWAKASAKVSTTQALRPVSSSLLAGRSPRGCSHVPNKTRWHACACMFQLPSSYLHTQDCMQLHTCQEGTQRHTSRKNVHIVSGTQVVKANLVQAPTCCLCMHACMQSTAPQLSFAACIPLTCCS